MQESGFTCDKLELLSLFNDLRSELSPKEEREMVLEIRVQPQVVYFNVPEKEKKLFCNTHGWGGYRISLLYFHTLMISYTAGIFSAIFKDGGLDVGGRFTRKMASSIDEHEVKPTLMLFDDPELLITKKELRRRRQEQISKAIYDQFISKSAIEKQIKDPS